MRDYKNAYAAAKDERPFSSGTEGYAWQDNWCDRCAHDAPYQRGERTEGCPLLMVALSGRTPAEWIEQPWQQIPGRPEGVTVPTLGDTYHCTEFRPDDSDSGDDDAEPQPHPVLPGQLDLFTANALDGLEAELTRQQVAA